jgi:hypothetical protein
VASKAVAIGHRSGGHASAAARRTGTFQSKHGPQTTRDHGVLIMRKLIAWVFMYSLDILLADEGTRVLAVLLRPARRPQRTRS